MGLFLTRLIRAKVWLALLAMAVVGILWSFDVISGETFWAVYAVLGPATGFAFGRRGGEPQMDADEHG